MASFPLIKAKRKDLDDVNEDFSDFSLSSPARKIRRLDAEVHPVIFEDGTEEMPLQFEEHPSSPVGFSTSNASLQAQLREPVEVELPPVVVEEENKERAIILFKPPPDNTLFNSPQSFIVDSDLISSIKRNQALWGTNSTQDQYIEDEESSKADGNLAMIPWVPSQQLNQKPIISEVSQLEVYSKPLDSEEMELDEAATATLTPDNSTLCSVSTHQANENTMLSDQGVQSHWQQQQCMVQQIPQNTTTPIVWYR